MKNLYIYLSNDKNPHFSKNAEELAKVQIENSFNLGWKTEDIIFVTNFDFEYMSVKAIKIDSPLCKWHAKANKIWGIVHMFQNNMIVDDMFFHDLDAFQVDSFLDVPDDVKGYDLAFPNYGHRERYNTGIIFFSLASKDLFIDLKKFMIENNSADEEEGLMYMFDMGKNKRYTNRFKILDVSYNIGKHHTEKKFIESRKPIMVVHFHPTIEPNYAFYCLGENKLKTPIIKKELSDLIEKHCFNKTL